MEEKNTKTNMETVFKKKHPIVAFRNQMIVEVGRDFERF